MEQMAGQIFDQKLLNNHFCTWAVKYGQNSLIVLSNHQNFFQFIKNCGCW